jgi:putative ABC transport system substrate-binding protein
VQVDVSRFIATRVSRRSLLSSITVLVATNPGILRAQTSQSRPVVVYLTTGVLPADLRATLVTGIAESGLEEGRDFDLAEREARNDPNRVPALIAEIVAQNPAVIVSSTTGLAVALHRATVSIPIVNSTIADPVDLGLAASLAHPGGNFTGMLSVSGEVGKQLELLHELTPEVQKVGLLLNPENAAHTKPYPKLDADAAALGITLIRVWAKSRPEIELAFQNLVRDEAGSLLVAQDPLFNQGAKVVAGLALTARLPTMYGFRFLPDAGGLASYGGDVRARYHRIGWYVAQILKGQKPGDLPIEQQEKLQFVVNMKTAKALGLTIPPVILARVDELIE